MGTPRRTLRRRETTAAAGDPLTLHSETLHSLQDAGLVRVSAAP